MLKAPSTNPITMPFGSTDPPYSAASPHLGVDYAYTPDDTIYAPADGKVTLVPNNGNDGNGVYMTVGNMFLGLLHTSKYLVSNGQTVVTGQPVAIMGDTGFAEGKHLHFALKVNGQFVNPLDYITQGDEMTADQESALNQLVAQMAGVYTQLDTLNAQMKGVYSQLDDLRGQLSAEPALSGTYEIKKVQS